MDPRQLPDAQYSELLDQTKHRLWASKNPFTAWLRVRYKQNGSVGALARVMLQDPTWPYPETRQQLTSYFMSMGARPFVMRTANEAWNGFEADQAKVARRTAARKKGKAQRQARKANRRAGRR